MIRERYKDYLNMEPKKAMGRVFLKLISDIIFKKHSDTLMMDEDPPLDKIVYELNAYEISDIFFNNTTGELTIVSGRPGIIIGARGHNLEFLEERLKFYGEKENLKLKRIKLVEDKYPIKNDLLYSINSYSLMRSPEEFDIF